MPFHHQKLCTSSSTHEPTCGVKSETYIDLSVTFFHQVCRSLKDIAFLQNIPEKILFFHQVCRSFPSIERHRFSSKHSPRKFYVFVGSTHAATTQFYTFRNPDIALVFDHHLKFPGDLTLVFCTRLKAHTEFKDTELCHNHHDALNKQYCFERLTEIWTQTMAPQRPTICSFVRGFQ